MASFTPTRFTLLVLLVAGMPALLGTAAVSPVLDLMKDAGIPAARSTRSVKRVGVKDAIFSISYNRSGASARRGSWCAVRESTPRSI